MVSREEIQRMRMASCSAGRTRGNSTVSHKARRSPYCLFYLSKMTSPEEYRVLRVIVELGNCLRVLLHGARQRVSVHVKNLRLP